MGGIRQKNLRRCATRSCEKQTEKSREKERNGDDRATAKTHAAKRQHRCDSGLDRALTSSCRTNIAQRGAVRAVRSRKGHFALSSVWRWSHGSAVAQAGRLRYSGSTCEVAAASSRRCSFRTTREPLSDHGQMPLPPPTNRKSARRFRRSLSCVEVTAKTV